jgi:uncharacterized membrane protein YhaH (DUF805 family)
MIGDDAVKAIQDLHELKQQGIITDAEFEQSKQRILFGQRTQQVATANAGVRPALDDHFAWITMPLRRYADFTGRSRRREFWMFQLIYVALVVGGGILIGGTADGYGEWSPFGNIVAGLVVLALLALIVPTLAVEARRFHDQNRSGWLVLLNLIPYIGWIIVAVMMLFEGTKGENRFGPDPKQE